MEEVVPLIFFARGNVHEFYGKSVHWKRLLWNPSGLDFSLGAKKKKETDSFRALKNREKKNIQEIRLVATTFY